ncbi:MAG: LytTR family DNA-binding domain-containing protein [Chitinophagaceae bacterium]
MDHISVLYNSKRVLIPVNEIIRVEASNNYSKIYCSVGRPLVVAKVLQWFELNLPEDAFYRIHQTHIINRFFVKEVQCKNRLQLTNGEYVQASRRKQTVFKMMLQKIAAE